VPAFRRDRITWVAYLVIAWFAYLQAAPGLVIPHLRDELGLSYTAGGLHVAAFAGGSALAGLLSARLERAVGRGSVLWSGTAVMGAGAIGLTAGPVAAVTIGSMFVMGVGGGLILATTQAALVDHHRERSAVALSEANVAASAAYVVLIGVLALTAALQFGWRVALLVSLLVPAVTWWRNRRLPIDTRTREAAASGSLPRVFWIAGAMLVCTTAAEWSITAWGATFLEDEVGLSADAAVALMVGYFGGVLVGRTVVSRLTRRYDPAPLLAVALAVAGAGFAVLWPATSAAQAVIGLSLLGLGIGNLFPMGLSVTVGLAPEQAGLVSGRAVMFTSAAVLLAPFTVGTLADATSLKAALGIVPVVLVLAAVGLALVRRSQGGGGAPAPAATSVESGAALPAGTSST
jgi:fucose permease